MHLCLSHTAASPEHNALLLAPSRTKLQEGLKAFNDDWIDERGGHGSTSKSAMKVQMLYPPTAAHLALVLTALHTSDVGGKEAFVPKATLPTTPSLIVICELSSYLVDNPASTVSSYLMLVTQTLTSIAALSSTTGSDTALAIYDSGLDSLRLPLVRPPSPNAFQIKVEGGEDNTRRESVGFLAARYFEWVGIVHAVRGDPAGEEENEVNGETRMCRMELRHSARGQESEITWQWMERKKKILSSPGYSTVFEWS
ncbi:hypothetical protein EIP91_012058 [Steccherinum ochraceum]|uniref:Uncharacterized protein n=1 Tax=Steccherinum ochraceum TaxID=92696 RepID=A0A4R0RKN4_9APHY|nr:hypothetical protein EIP91_012058 [Steccherinum ochraceum]